MRAIELFEVDWNERSPLSKEIKRYSDKWIHFTNGIRQNGKVFPKIGINPSMPFHSDPPGIYFYPVKFILGDSERVRKGNQYGLDMPFYYIADINMRNGLHLGSMSESQVEKVVSRNNLQDEYEQFDKNLVSPGKRFWEFVRTMVAHKKTTWLKALKGIDYIHDDSGIIHFNEPEQILVLNPRIIKIIKQGENKSSREIDLDKEEAWQHTFKDLFKMLRGEFGGNLSWKDNKQILHFSTDNADYTIQQLWSWEGPRLQIEYKQDRATGIFSIRDEFKTQDLENIIEKIRNKIKIISRRKTDLLFEPIMSINEAKEKLGNITNIPIEFDTEIQNERKIIFVKGETKSGIVQVIVHCSIKEDDFKMGFVIRVNDRSMANIDIENENYVEASHNLKKELENSTKSVRPGGYGRTFHREEDADAFSGFLIHNAEISLNGKAPEILNDELSRFFNYEYRENMTDEVEYVFKKRW